YDSDTFPYQGAASGTWDSCDPSAPANKVARFNVKVSEQNLKSVLGGLSATRAAEAEVAIGTATGGTPDMGLAIPDVNPDDVAITFRSQLGTTTCSPSCTVHLTKQGPLNGYNWWSGTVSLNVANS